MSLVSFLIVEILLGGILAQQADMIPDFLLAFLSQLPFVAILIWLDIQNKKWLEKMLGLQREMLKEVYAANIDRLFQMSDKLEGLTRVIDKLLARLDKRNGL